MSFGKIAKENLVCSVPSVTFQSQLSNKNCDALQIIPGQGYKYFERPKFSVLTNFSPFKMDTETHPWMGLDRYNKALLMLNKVNTNFNVNNMFEILKSTSQEVCPTIVNMVFDVSENTVYWCENREWDKIQSKKLKKC